MKKEKLILLFIATLLGLVVAGVLFYLYQTTKTVSTTSTKTITLTSPTPTAAPAISLVLDRPKDEEVVSEKVLIVSGKTQSNATIVILTDSSEDVISPSANGNFSTTVTLEDGENILEVTSISPNGENITIKKTVTYSLEEF